MSVVFIHRFSIRLLSLIYGQYSRFHLSVVPPSHGSLVGEASHSCCQLNGSQLREAPLDEKGYSNSCCFVVVWREVANMVVEAQLHCTPCIGWLSDVDSWSQFLPATDSSEQPSFLAWQNLCKVNWAEGRMQFELQQQALVLLTAHCVLNFLCCNFSLSQEQTTDWLLKWWPGIYIWEAINSRKWYPFVWHKDFWWDVVTLLCVDAWLCVLCCSVLCCVVMIYEFIAYWCTCVGKYLYKSNLTLDEFLLLVSLQPSYCLGLSISINS